MSLTAPPNRTRTVEGKHPAVLELSPTARYVRLVRPRQFGRTPRSDRLVKTREGLRLMDEPDQSVLRERAENGDADAVDQLIELAGEQGNLEELRRLADQGNTTASEVLRELEE